MSLENTNPRLRPIDQFKHIKPGKAFTLNLKFTEISMYAQATVNLMAWLSILLQCSGDIRPNPGPSSVSSVSSASNPSNSNQTFLVISLVP